MLRALQTNALSNKITTLFDTLAKTAQPTMQPAMAQSPRRTVTKNANTASIPSPLRRRRNRRRMTTATGSIRTAWY